MSDNLQQTVERAIIEKRLDEERIAPEGQIWICGACGKTSRDRYGDPGTSWDESCFLKAVLVWEKSIVRSPGGVSADAVKPGEPPP